MGRRLPCTSVWPEAIRFEDVPYFCKRHRLYGLLCVVLSALLSRSARKRWRFSEL